MLFLASLKHHNDRARSAFGTAARLVLVWSLFPFSPSEAAQDRVLGLLTMPELFGQESCEKFVPAEVALYSAPESRRVGSLRVKDTEGTPAHCWLPVTVHLQGDPRVNQMPTREYEYEAPAAIVLEQRGRWFRVQLVEGSTWVHASTRDEYLPLEKLLTDGLTYLTEASDGRLSASPGGAPPVDRERFAAARPVRVQGFQRVGDRLWIQIQVMTHSICTSIDEPKIEAEGWVPAHARSGEPTVWLYSRGC